MFPSEVEIDDSYEGGSLDHTKWALEYILGTDSIYIGDHQIYDEETLRSILDTNCPVIISRGWYENGQRDGGHSTVICGYIYNADADTFMYEIFDPWPVNIGDVYFRTYAWICDGSTTETDAGTNDNGIWESVVLLQSGDYTNTIPWPGVS